MTNLETIVNQPQKKGFFRRVGNWVGGALLTGSLLLGAYLPGCVGRGEEYVVPDETTTPPITTPDTTPPADVSNFTATAGNFSADLTWMNPSDADFEGVIIRRKTASFPANPTDGTFVYQGTAQSRTDSGLTDGITYRYRIFSFDEVPNYSSGVSDSTVPLDNLPPANVTNLIATAKYLSIDLAWTNPGDIDFAGTKILRKTASYPTNPTDGTVVYTGTNQTHTDSGLVEKVNYYYTAFSFDEVPNYPSGSNTTAQPYGVYAIGWIGGGSNGWKTVSGANSGSDYQSCNNPSGVFVDTSGNIYVADASNNRISKWDNAGNAMGWIGGGSNGWKTGTAPPSGADYQSFYSQSGIFVDNSGTIYVVDTHLNRVSKWSSAGNAMGWIGGGSNGWKTTLGATSGNDYQSFDDPYGISIDNSGNIYVADSLNLRVSKWNSAGNAMGWIGGGSNGWKTFGISGGSGYQHFNLPKDVFVDTNGDIYVADTQNHRVSKWDAAGNAIGWIGGGSNGWKTTSGTDIGWDYQSFYIPCNVFLDSDDNIYIASGNNRISKWNRSGNAIGWISGGTDWNVGTGATSGNDYQSFDDPHGLFVDSNSNIYVADKFNNRISKWKD